MKKLLIALVLVASSAQAEQLICPVLDIYQAKSTNEGLVYTKESTNVQSVPFNAKVDSTVIEITKLDYVVVQAYKDYNEFRTDTGRAEYNAVNKTITYQTVNNKLEPVKLIWHCRG